MNLAQISQSPEFFIVWLAAILISLTVHEFFHALMATNLGDGTAKYLGRLTLNPLAHIDPLGFMALILVGFGWGKPVPFNPDNLRSKRFGPGLVGVAGPFANFLMAALSLIFFKILASFTNLGPTNLLMMFLFLMINLNVILMAFNLVPLPPLDGSKLFFAFLPDSLHGVELFLEKWGPWILIFLIIFDQALPVPILGSLFNWVLNLVNRLL